MHKIVVNAFVDIDPTALDVLPAAILGEASGYLLPDRLPFRMLDLHLSRFHHLSQIEFGSTYVASCHKLACLLSIDDHFALVVAAHVDSATCDAAPAGFTNHPCQSTLAMSSPTMC